MRNGGVVFGIVAVAGLLSNGGLHEDQKIHIGSATLVSYMNSVLRIPLNTSPEQTGRLEALQTGFARVCNALAPVVRQTRVWNRVALHHLAYRQLREQFPEMGSQMVCNAIYSVSRTSRLVFQHPGSPFNVARLGEKSLPLLRFADSCPVYFDRHTLSLKAGQLSMFTLDGRMKFQLALRPEDEQGFHDRKLREIVLSRRIDGVYELSFLFAEAQGLGEESSAVGAVSGEIPEYIMVEEVV